MINVYDKLKITFPNFIQYQNVFDINNYINFLYNIYSTSFYFYDTLYDFELKEYLKLNKINNIDNFNKKDYTNILLNLSFKLDSIHDFTGSRAKDILIDETDSENTQNIIEITKKELLRTLNWDQIYDKIKKPSYIENNYFYWLLNKFNQLQDIFSKNELPKVIFTTSIENYTKCVSKEKSFLTIDAIESRIRNFKNYLLFNNIVYDQNLNEIEEEIENISTYNTDYKIKYNQINMIFNNIEKNIDNLELNYKDNIDKIIKYFVYMFNYNEYLSFNTLRYLFIIILKYIIIKNEYDIKLIDFTNKIKKIHENSNNIKKINETLNQNIKNNYINCNSIDKYLNEDKNNIDYINIKNNCNSIKEIFDFQNIICNNNEKYYLCDIIRFFMENFDEIVKKKTSQDKPSDFFITSNILYKYDKLSEYIKLIKNTYNSVYNEIIETLNTFEYEEDIKNSLTQKFIENEGNISLKIISPQLFDANATTGNKITAKHLDINAELDNTGYYCNIGNFDINQINYIKNMNNYSNIFNELYNQRSILKNTLYSSYGKEINKEEINKEELKITYTNLYNQLIMFNNFILSNKNISKSDIKQPNFISTFINNFINILNMIINENNISYYLNNLQKTYDNLNIILSSFIYNDKNYCCYNIINNTVCINKYNYEYEPASNITFDFDILKININNTDSKIDLQYAINTIYIMNIKNKNTIMSNDRYKSDDDMKINKNFINDKLKCMNAFYETTKGKKTFIIYVDNYMIDIESKQLYCIDSGPGVTDIVQMYNKLKINDENTNSHILENLLTIKRIGDYSQIEYCKKNNYIYISNDMMSASFSYITGCKFIGSLKNFGIFVKTEGEYKDCVSYYNDIIKCPLNI